MQKAQRVLLLVLPIAFIPFVLNFPAGLMLYWLTTNLWTTGQGLDHAPADAEAAAAAEEELVGRRRRTAATAERGRRPRSRPPRSRPAATAAARAQGEAEEGRRRGDERELSVEATGETVGEAKWAALRELERMRPGLDKAAVRFQVVTEGERGLLGVGYEPARVVASVDERRRAGRSRLAAAPRGESDDAARLREVVERIAHELGVHCTVESRRATTEIRVVCDGHDLGLLIGRHGQTIDAIQYLANAILFRGRYDERKPVVVDAAGYRDRRQATLDALALRSAEQALGDRAAGRARADDRRRAQDRPREAEGRSRGRDGERGHGAEPLRRHLPAPRRRLTLLERWLAAVVATPGLTALRDPAEARRVLLDDALAGVELVRALRRADRGRRLAAAARPGSRSRRRSPSAR